MFNQIMPYIILYVMYTVIIHLEIINNKYLYYNFYQYIYNIVYTISLLQYLIYNYSYVIDVNLL